MKRTILLAAAITGVVFLSGCTDTSAKDATEAVKKCVYTSNPGIGSSKRR